MKELIVNPGDVVVTSFTGYQHWSLVSDNVCEQGFPLLISATQRSGTVMEEPWHVVTKGNKTYVADVKLSAPAYNVIERARSQIGEWKYSLSNRNCEHFVKWAANLDVSSKQITAGVGGAILGASAIGFLAENPKAAKIVGGALLLGGLAVWLARPPNKYDKEVKFLK